MRVTNHTSHPNTLPLPCQIALRWTSTGNLAQGMKQLVKKCKLLEQSLAVESCAKIWAIGVKSLNAEQHNKRAMALQRSERLDNEFDLKFEISNLNDLNIHLHIASSSNCDDL